MASDWNLWLRKLDLMISLINSKTIQRDLSSGYFRGEVTLSVGISKDVTEDPPHVTVSFQFPASPASVPVKLLACPTATHPFAAVVALVPVAWSEQVENGVAEPSSPERSFLPKQEVRLSDCLLLSDSLQDTRTLSEIPRRIIRAEEWLSVEAYYRPATSTPSSENEHTSS